MKVSKWWQKFHFWLKSHFNVTIKACVLELVHFSFKKQKESLADSVAMEVGLF